MGHLISVRLPYAFMVPQTIMEYPPYFIVWQTKLVCNLGSFHFLTNLRRIGIICIRHSSEKITLLQSTGSNVVYSLYPFFCFAILHLLRNGFFTAILEKSSPARNTLWTVHNETFLGILERKCTAFADWNWSFRHFRHNTLFSRIVNFFDLPLLFKFSTFTVAWNLFHRSRGTF